MKQDDTRTKLNQFIDSLNITYQATFVPTTQPKETVEYPQLHWLIELTRWPHVATFPYQQGIAHVEGYRHPPLRLTIREAEIQETFRRTCETGKIYRAASIRPQPAPDRLDVLYCLVSEANVLNYPTYEQWAPEVGYDPDSPKGEAVYRKCLEHTLALLPVLGGQANLEQLRELFQDY